ncbi:MAG TPA: RDD family protein [Acidimicrobiales bacterium]|nr:RDD family protein [Acidimicrobiales bacterium]
MALGVVTPEAVVLEFETAGVASRLIGGLLDALIQVVLVIAVFAGVGALEGAGVNLGGVVFALVYVALFLVIFGYPAAFETLWRGRTPGKAALGLRVVTVEGGPIRFRHAAIRAILGLVDKWATQGSVGVLAILLTGRNQRLGDLVAGTLVLRERTGAGRQRAVRFFAPRGLERYVATLDVSGLGNGDYQTVRAFLLRASTLPPAARADLAARLAWPLAQRIHADPGGLHPEVFLACVAAAVQQRRVPASEPAFTSVWATPFSGVPSWSPSGSAGSAPAPAAVPPAPAGGFAPPG